MTPGAKYLVIVASPDTLGVVLDGKPVFGIKLVAPVLQDNMGMPISIGLASPKVCEGQANNVYINGAPVGVLLVVDFRQYE